MVNIECWYGQVVMKVNDYVLKQALEFDAKGQKEDKRLKNVLTFLVSGGGGGVDPIPSVSTHRISDPRSGPAQLLPPHVKQRSHPHGVRPQIPDR